MLCSYTSPRYQVSVYRTIGPLVLKDIYEYGDSHVMVSNAL